MPKFSRGRIFLLLFFAIMLLAIPATVFLVSQQLHTTTKAERSTTLSFSPVANSATVGGTVSFDVYVSPGSNIVNFIKMAVKYDPSLISADAGSFELDPASKLNITQGPTLSEDGITLALSTT